MRVVPLSAEVVQRAVKSNSEAEYRTIVRDVQADPSAAVTVLHGLAGSPDRGIREWLATNARAILGRASSPVLLALTDDRDAEVREIAMEELVQTDPTVAKPLADRFRRKLEGKGFHDAVQGMWALAAIRETSAAEAIRAAGERERRAGKLFAGTTADIVLLLLDGHDAEILRRIGAHDHEAMFALTKGARLLGTAEARATLAHGVQDLPDKECRGYCERALRLLITD